MKETGKKPFKILIMCIKIKKNLKCFFLIFKAQKLFSIYFKLTKTLRKCFCFVNIHNMVPYFDIYRYSGKDRYRLTLGVALLIG